MATTCYLCQYVNDLGKRCEACPIDWPQKTSHHQALCLNSLYTTWRYSSTEEERKRIARLISELPEKKDK